MYALSNQCTPSAAFRLQYHLNLHLLIAVRKTEDLRMEFIRNKMFSLQRINFTIFPLKISEYKTYNSLLTFHLQLSIILENCDNSIITVLSLLTSLVFDSLLSVNQLFAKWPTFWSHNRNVLSILFFLKDISMKATWDRDSNGWLCKRLSITLHHLLCRH